MLLAKYIRSNVEKVQQGQSVLSLILLLTHSVAYWVERFTRACVYCRNALPLQATMKYRVGTSVLDIDAIASVLNSMKVTLAAELEDELAAVYHSHALTEYTIDYYLIGKRAISRKVCLSYLEGPHWSRVMTWLLRCTNKRIT
ncbi:aminopeptidase N C-terminal domain-containing protein [Vibrio chagasii]|nr:aminopeptidase N C-terminal domain-containing protein [Vibrio chagasii]